MTERRWPIEPLLARTKLTGHGLRQQARIHSEIYKRAAEEGLTDRQADTWATRCALHPTQVWGWAWVESGLSHLDRQYLAGGWRQAWLWNETRTELREAA